MRVDRTTTGVGFVLAVATIALLVSGCSSTATTQQKTVAAVSASEASLVAAGKVIMACYSVPACDKVAPKAQIKKAFDDAYSAVTAAQATADAGGTPTATAEAAAASAVATLQGLVAQLPKTSS
jgi:hypothetical protein